VGGNAGSLVLSPDILTEYQRVGSELGKRYPERTAALEPILALLATTAVMVDAPPLPEPVGSDPADEMFLAAALASKTRMIVSGDRDLLRLSGWREIRVCTPRQFCDGFLAG
jgi:putative PIN family toxin of toxin-antitoxin system